MRCLVTGGAGFVGSHVAEALVRAGCDVVVLDNFDPFYRGKMRNLKGVLGSRHFRLIRGSVLDRRTVAKGCRDVDVVYHLAAQSGVRYSVGAPDKTYLVNTLGTLRVLEAARASGVSRFVLASSSSVYGRRGAVMLTEEAVPAPVSPYAVSKLVAESYCRSADASSGPATVVLRYFTVLGPRQRPDMAAMLFLSALVEGRPLRILGDGGQTRDFTYVEDVANANLRLLDRDRADGKVVNIGASNPVSVNELIAQLERVSGLNATVNCVEASGSDADHTWADNRLARRLLGWSPRVSFREGVRRFVLWYLDAFAPNKHRAKLRAG